MSDEPNRASKKQRELLLFIDGFIKGNGYGPSYREVMRSLNYKSVSTVAAHVDNLIARGYLEKKDNSARSLVVLKTDDGKTAVAVTHSGSWLVRQVEKKFKDFEEHGGVIDDLYVLVGALHVLDIKEASSYKARLAKLIN